MRLISVFQSPCRARTIVPSPPRRANSRHGHPATLLLLKLVRLFIVQLQPPRIIAAASCWRQSVTGAQQLARHEELIHQSGTT